MRLYHEYSEKSKYEHQLKDQGAWSVEVRALASPKIYPESIHQGVPAGYLSSKQGHDGETHLFYVHMRAFPK